MADTEWRAPGVTGTLQRRRGRRWYLGGLVSLAWLAWPVSRMWEGSLPLSMKIAGSMLIVVWAAFFLLLPPLLWCRPQRWRFLSIGVLFATTLLFIPFFGSGTASLWVFVGVAAAMSSLHVRAVAVIAVALAILVFVAERTENAPDAALTLALVVLSVSMMMAGFVRQIDLVRQLREAEGETARLAVDEERNRVARDIHDLLGHSLTVITVKAELAGRLLDENPPGAATEIADIERLARDALADVRSTVTGYRGINLAAELSGAREGLNSAGIQADLPNSVDGVRAEYRQLFGWVVREGVTNVIRHSGAASCRITLEADSITIADDGQGPGSEIVPSAALGNGLRGLSERVVAAGASLAVGRDASGGFLLKVTR